MRKFLLAGVVLALAICGLSMSPAEARAQGVTLNDDSLPKMLTDMGYQSKKLSHGFLIVVRQGSWTLNVQTVLSADHTKFGLNANLGDVPNEQAVSAAQWKNLLETNGDIDPSSFYYDARQKRLLLHRSFDNRALTPAIVKTQIDAFIGQIRSTESVWSGVVK